MPTAMNDLIIYAAGEIHSDWRDDLRHALEPHDIDAHIVGPQEVHARSDDVGEDILGEQPGARYRDLMGARVNTLRTRVLMGRADLAVAYFGLSAPRHKYGCIRTRPRFARCPHHAMRRLSSSK
jgi:YtoQ family protein